jgi:hypothetical protein
LQLRQKVNIAITVTAGKAGITATKVNIKVKAGEHCNNSYISRSESSAEFYCTIIVTAKLG